MAASKFRLQDWRFGWLIKQANDTVSVPGTTLVDSTGTEYGASNPLPTTIASGYFPSGYSYKHIAAGQATTVVKTSAGVLHSVTFGGPATATNVTTIYDDSAGVGVVIGIPTATAVVGPVTMVYDIAFANGLTIITGTANGADMTVSYR